MMNIAKTISLIGLLAMTIVLANGFINGNIAAEGAWLLAHPWGIVSLVDLYVGFALYSIWIAYREKSVLNTIVWIVLMIVLGFWAGALYMFLALNTSKGDWQKFWLGARAR
jgi:hypothetical protein